MVQDLLGNRVLFHKENGALSLLRWLGMGL